MWINNENTKYKIIKNSQALIYPSLFEGYGMPLIEAIMLNTPILCSDLEVLKEIVENNDCLFDPKKPKSIANIIVKIFNDDNFLKNSRKNVTMLNNKVPLMQDVVNSYNKILFSDCN